MGGKRNGQFNASEKRTGILCPDVVTLKQHVLVMSFIGEDHRPAPKLKDAKMSKEDRFGVYEEIVEAMKTLYVKRKLSSCRFVRI
ncbi:hypothetical protein NQ318_014013 [Aromia moschata]|uniref:non-specific serine/threonine protein kinase n=1 Tax=Aromia moschata TaxID=1265417 RepID=A0AAV8YY29_9CUCU|nr:hypothetical protein NQ318_014013 [Aromia moschata]